MNNNSREKWRNIASIILKNINQFSQLLTDEEQRIRIQFFLVYIIFCLVSSFMTVVNVITGWKELMLSTLVFAVVNLVNVLLCFINRKTEFFSRILFAVEIITLFAFFCVCGEPEGFSAIWIALLPACGLLLYRLKSGLIISTVQLLIVIFFFWTETGNSLLHYEYTQSFCMRFPMLYCAFFMVGVLFEYIRHATQKELMATREKFEYLSTHDLLTGVSNRLGFNNDVDEILLHGGKHCYAIAITDIDDFKSVNDTYGHGNGDIVLKETAAVISQVVGENGIVCRWGGEEFCVLFTEGEKASDLCESILSIIRAHEFDFAGVKTSVTVSIGLVEFDGADRKEIARVFNCADDNLYTAKNSGKDRLVVSKL